MAKQPWSKKTEKIEVRLSPETKAAFGEACDKNNQSASSVIRGLVEDYIARFRKRSAFRDAHSGWRARLAALTALGAGAGGLALLPSTAETGPARQFIDHIDPDGDGAASLKDYLNWKNRYTASEEMQASLNETHTSEFSEIDTNQDAVLTKHEYVDFARREGDRRFALLDINTSGQITLAELLSATGEAEAWVTGMAMGLAFSDRSDNVSDWASSQGDQLHARKAARIGQAFETLDTDNDGAVTRREFPD